MGWRDGTPDRQPGDSPAPAAAPNAPAAAPAAGWRSGTTDSAKPTPPPVPDAAAVAQADLDKGPSDTSGYALQRAASTGTLGASDWLGAGINAISRATGLDPNAPTHAEIVKQNEEFGTAHPYIAAGSDIAGYTLGAGKLSPIAGGGRIAEALGGNFAARAAGYGLENAGASAISGAAADPSKLTTGEGILDLAKHAGVAGTVGAITGSIPGRGALADAASPTKGIAKDVTDAFKPLDQTHYDPNVIGQQFNAIGAARQSGTISDSLNNQIGKITSAIAEKQKAGASVTAGEITNWQIAIRKASQGGNDAPIAKTFDTALDSTLANTRPLYSPLASPAAISGASDAATSKALQKNVSSDIDDWIAQAKNNPSAAANDIFKSVTKNPGFYPGSVGELLKQAGAPSFGSKVADAAKLAAVEGAIGAGSSLITGGNPWLEGIVGAVGGTAQSHFMGKPGTGNLTGKLKVARELNATGNQVNPSDFSRGIIPGPLGAYARDWAPSMGVGVGVSNLFGQ